ncbi:DUF2911 domain-containing protein [Filimonas effusa]|uniref:DUF2911 domain-containing protein n=1 Tax=Filimonas effusa TaxID=2508721 RepID=A0A4Q1D861_9BACT|nr:DUF2911 domain-containing protein [Filimonas effusa]RXK85451.1 DUF2911 domain-containing protein [Filimonas effusa]
MKRMYALAIGVMMACAANVAVAQVKIPAPSPAQTVKQAFGLGDITVEYSRPALKGRKLLTDLAPAGKVWRTGANATTKITFTEDVKLEGKTVAAGTYGLYSVPNAGSWDIMLYKDLKLAGNVADYKTEDEVLRLKVKTVKGQFTESFTIAFDNVLPTSATMLLSWGTIAVPVKITCDIDSRIMASIEKSVASEKPAYFPAATYYYENGKDLSKALLWVNKALEQNPQAFYMMLLKARIELKMGDKKAALQSAQKTVALSEAAKNDDYVRMAKALITEAKK